MYSNWQLQRSDWVQSAPQKMIDRLVLKVCDRFGIDRTVEQLTATSSAIAWLRTRGEWGAEGGVVGRVLVSEGLLHEEDLNITLESINDVKPCPLLLTDLPDEKSDDKAESVRTIVSNATHSPFPADWLRALDQIGELFKDA